MVLFFSEKSREKDKKNFTVTSFVLCLKERYEKKRRELDRKFYVYLLFVSLFLLVFSFSFCWFFLGLF